MQSRVYRFIALAAGLMLASGCSGDNPAAPAVSSALNGASIPLASAIKSDIAASAGNAIANDVESLPISLGDYSCVLHLDTKKVDGCR